MAARAGSGLQFAVEALRLVNRIKLGELLVRAGVLDETRLKAALTEQARWGGRIGSRMVAMGFISEEILAKALSKQLQVPIARLDQIDVPPNILSKVELELARMHTMCPERYLPDRRTLLLAMADPINVAAIDEVARRTGCRVQPTIAGEHAIERAIALVYGTEPPSFEDQIEVFGEAKREALRASMGAPSDRVRISSIPVPHNAGGGGDETNLSPPEMVANLDAAQKKQLKAIRAMADLLIEKGLFSREEYNARIHRRG